MTITFKEAKRQLRQIIQKGAEGEPIILTDGNGSHFRVQVTPLAEPSQERLFGSAKGRIKIGADFDDPIPGFESYLS